MLHYKHSILKYKMKHRLSFLSCCYRVVSFYPKRFAVCPEMQDQKRYQYGPVLDSEGEYMGIQTFGRLFLVKMP